MSKCYTKCNFILVNIDNKIGAIGFISRIIPSIYPISIIKVDANGEPIRNSKGLCQVCEPSKLTYPLIFNDRKIYSLFGQ